MWRGTAVHSAHEGLCGVQVFCGCRMYRADVLTLLTMTLMSCCDYTNIVHYCCGCVCVLCCIYRTEQIGQTVLTREGREMVVAA